MRRVSRVEPLICPRCSRRLRSCEGDIAVYCSSCIHIYQIGETFSNYDGGCIFIEPPHLKSNLSLPFWRFTYKDSSQDANKDVVLKTIYLPAFSSSIIIVRNLTIGLTLGHFNFRVVPGTRLLGISISPDEAFNLANIFFSYSFLDKHIGSIKDYKSEMVGLPFLFEEGVLIDQLLGIEVNSDKVYRGILDVWGLV